WAGCRRSRWAGLGSWSTLLRWSSDENRVAGGPLPEDFSIWLHETLLCESALLLRELTALDAVVDDRGGGGVLMVQGRPVDVTGGSVRVVEFGPVGLLEGLHHADRAGELQV